MVSTKTLLLKHYYRRQGSCLKAFFRRASVFETHRHAVYHCFLIIKEVQKPFRHASVFKMRAFRHATLSFHSLVFLFYQGKTSNLPRISLTAEPTNQWKRQRKYQNNQGNSLLEINQGNPKNQGKEGQGSVSVFKTRVFAHLRKEGGNNTLEGAPRTNPQSLWPVPRTGLDDSSALLLASTHVVVA